VNPVPPLRSPTRYDPPGRAGTPAPPSGPTPPAPDHSGDRAAEKRQPTTRERGRVRIIKKVQEPLVSYTQTIIATLWIAGPQQVQVNTHGVRGPGSHISLTAEQVLIYLHDQRAALAYADAFTDAVLLAKHLPDTINVTQRHTGPALVIRAYGQDRVDHVYDPTLQAVIIRIGHFTWLIRDRAAYDTMTAAWDQVRELAPIILRGDPAPSLIRKS